ncbi:MAG: energy-coupling factor transporter transmembrane protein EcfT [Coriobacteriia bacterium]|nr:energy-coupling factor transporter transmembrane protein EcfT [Coriobacteriia bacterium]
MTDQASNYDLHSEDIPSPDDWGRLGGSAGIAQPKLRSAFADTHPLVEMGFFVMVILLAALFWHPVTLSISFVSALGYAIRLKGWAALRFTLAALLPMMLVAVAINVLFTHRGETTLFYLWDDNPFTLESLLAGIAAAEMIGTVLLWFVCYNAIMTSDKFLYLFARLVPALALVISMALRLIPRYRVQITRIAEAQAAIGRGLGTGKVWVRARNGLTILSVAITWALENGVETADSMHARGYGLAGRSSYSIFSLDRRDKLLLAALAYLAAVCSAAIGFGIIGVEFYNTFSINPLSPLTGLVYALFTIAHTLPLLVDGYEALVWRSLRSSI